MRRSLLLALAAVLLMAAGSWSPAVAETAPPAGGGAGRVGDVQVKVPPRPAAASGKLAVARSQVVSYSATIPAHEIWYLYVYCPAGMKATGGGGTGYSQGYGNELRFTRALDGGDGWIVDVANTTGTNLPFYVQAVCFSGLSNYSLQTATGFLPGAGRGPGKTYANCPSGMVVGSGVWASTYNVTLAAAIAFDGGTSAHVMMFGQDSADGTITAQAVCADGIANLSKPYAERESPAAGFRSVDMECPVGTTVVSPGAWLVGGTLLGFSVSLRWATTWLRSDAPGQDAAFQPVCGS